MKTTLLAAAALAVSTGPLFAMQHADPTTFTCAGYLELSPEDQQVAADALQSAETEAGNGMMAEDGTTALEGEDLTAAVTEKCSADGMADMTLMDAAMAEGQ